MFLRETGDTEFPSGAFRDLPGDHHLDRRHPPGEGFHRPDHQAHVLIGGVRERPQIELGQ